MYKFPYVLFMLRKQNNMSMQELCDRVNSKFGINLTKGQISKYESGLVSPSFSTGECLADILGVTTDYLLGRSEIMYYDGGKFKSIPVLGTIAAGQPIYAVENRIGYEYTDDDSDFCLIVKGDSMIGARIYDGDTVYIHQQPDVEHGELAAVIIDNEDATLKRIFKVNGNIILHPENPAYKDMVFNKKGLKEVRILGKVKSVKFKVR